MKHNLNPVMNAQLDRNRRIRTHRRNLSDPRFSTSLTDSLGEDEVNIIYHFHEKIVSQNFSVHFSMHYRLDSGCTYGRRKLTPIQSVLQIAFSFERNFHHHFLAHDGIF